MLSESKERQCGTSDSPTRISQAVLSRVDWLRGGTSLLSNSQFSKVKLSLPFSAVLHSKIVQHGSFEKPVSSRDFRKPVEVSTFS